MPVQTISYTEFSKKVQDLFDRINRLLSQRPAVPQAANQQLTGYNRYHQLSFKESLPFLGLYDALQQALNSDQLRQLVKQYQALQPPNNPNFTDKLAVSSESYDLYREIQGLTTEQTETLLQLKYLLDVKRNLDFVHEHGENFPDKDALKIRQINDYIVPYTSCTLKKIATEYQRNHGHVLSLSAAELESHELARAGFWTLTLAKTYPIAAVELYKTALTETNTRFTAPLLYLNSPLIQCYSVSKYVEKINKILDAQPDHTHFDLLSATDTFFHQISLSSAIGLDNSNAALAFIQVIETATTLSSEQKKRLLNHRSQNTSTGWSKEIYSATPLLLAIQRGNKKVVDALLNSAFIDVNQPDLKNLTPLDWAFIMADASLCQKLLQKGADPRKAYYRTHSWNEKIWEPSDDVLARTLIVNDAKLTSEHPELRQLCAHFWDSPEKFFAMRHHNPQAKVCDDLLHGAPAAELNSLPELFKPDFQHYINALIKRQQVLTQSTTRIDNDLADKVLQFVTIFKTKANTCATLLNSNAVAQTKQQALQQFKRDIQGSVLALRQDIQTQFVPHQHQMSDHLIMALNDLLAILDIFFKRINNYLSKTPQPITIRPYSFFEEKISTDRLVSEFSNCLTAYTP